MSPRAGGIRRSSWRTVRRRLLLVRLLMQQPLAGRDLIAAIQAELGEDGYPAAALSAIKHDFDALKREYGCDITYDHASNSYHLTGLGELALLNLPPDCMEALAVLEASLPASNPIADGYPLASLFARIAMLLPPNQKYGYQRSREVLRRSLTP
jgi:hypothetical protein